MNLKKKLNPTYFTKVFKQVYLHKPILFIAERE